MARLNLPVGISDFAEIRRNHNYYVDKTGLIFQLLDKAAAKVTLITRPRRFGKTLAMSMLANFFDIRKDSGKLFQGLEIFENQELCENWMNQYPTVFFSFKDVDGLDFAGAYGIMKALIAYDFQQYEFLLHSSAVHEHDRTCFSHILRNEASVEEIKTSFLTLVRMLYAHYKKPVILLIDEYDVPVAKASGNGYYNEMLDIVKTILGTVLKDNSFLKFAVVTGCLKITKESIFTGTNNFVSDTISSSKLNECFGFTQCDVDQLLDAAGLKVYGKDIKNWYDGYHFGSFDVYCPWDVMNYLRDLQWDSSAKPRSYWKNTSDNGLIRSFLDFAGATITTKLETLLEGGFITQKIEDDLTYDYLHASEDNLWSVLYLTGYLTRVQDHKVTKTLPDGVSALKIPNAEIREIFESTIMKWFDESAQTWNRQSLFDAVWSGDSEGLTKEMNKLLRRTISYHDYREDFYHAFLAGIFTGAGYMVESNREHGEGRSDVVVYDAIEGRVAVFEAKYSKKLENMKKGCEAALQQIDEKMYAREFEDDYDQVLCYGISFFKKRCMVKRK